MPGFGWLLLFFVTPFYAILVVAMGRLHPIFVSAPSVWNLLPWNPGVFSHVFTDVFGGQTGAIFVRTMLYVGAASAMCLLIGYPVAYYLTRHAHRYRNLLLVLIVAPFWINYLMRMLAWVNLLGTNGY